MKVVSLVNPPQIELREPKSYIPLGLAYLASSLRNHGINVRVDNLADKKEISLKHADYFGITYPSATKEGVAKIVEYIRQVYPESKIILGGPNPTVAPKKTYEEMKPDTVIMGEAVEFLPSFIANFRPGIFDAGVVENVDSLPFPARDLFERKDVVNITGIHGSKKPSTTVITSFGCPYKCYFCCRNHLMYSRYRYRSPEDVFLELLHLVEDYAVEHIRFIDDCFTLIPQRVKKICEYTKKLGLTFICITRADRTTLELLQILKDGGCKTIDIGVESPSPRLLKIMNKQETVEQLKSCIIKAKKVGLETKVFLQYGLPTETEEDLHMTLSFLEETKPDYYTLSKFTPLPGSTWETYLNKNDDGWFYHDDDAKRKRLIEEINRILTR